jgi:hypothetical protein
MPPGVTASKKLKPFAVEASIMGRLSILNLNSEELLQQEITKPKTTIDISGLKCGIYFLRIAGDKTIKVGKFVKQ